MIVITASLGQAQRRSRRRGDRLEPTLEMLDDAHRRLAEDAVLVECNRIAREMHDIVAHGLSVIAVCAGVARALLPGELVSSGRPSPAKRQQLIWSGWLR